MQKILATDLDGTLFYPKSKKEMINSKNLKLIRDFVDEGNKLILISGRSLDYCKLVEQKINRPCTLICFNGSIIYDNGQIIYNNPLNNDSLSTLLKEVYDEFNLPGIFIMTKKGTFIKMRTNSKLKKFAYKLYYKSQGIYSEKFFRDYEDYLKEIEGGDIYKVMLYFGIRKKNIAKANEINKVFRNTLKDFEFAWSNNVIEITNKNCFKGKALKDYISEKKLENCKVFVVGDSGNDISMFKEFYENSYCMDHSNKVVKKYSHFIIDKFTDLSSKILEK